MIKDIQTRVIVLILIVLVILSFFYANISVDNDKSLQMRVAASLVTGTDELMKDSQCNCASLKRNISHLDANNNAIGNITLKNTTCSQSAFERGPHQKVVAFTFYESDSELGVKSEKTRHYFEGIRDNLALMKEYYPDFVMRLYYEVPDQTESKLCRLGKLPILCLDQSIKKLISTSNQVMNDPVWCVCCQ